MTMTVIEATDKALLDFHRYSSDFQKEFGAHNPVVKEGVNENAELDDQGTTGTLFWLLIEDDRADDNATFRLDSEGLHFWATGVEV